MCFRILKRIQKMPKKLSSLRPLSGYPRFYGELKRSKEKTTVNSNSLGYKKNASTRRLLILRKDFVQEESDLKTTLRITRKSVHEKIRMRTKMLNTYLQGMVGFIPLDVRRQLVSLLNQCLEVLEPNWPFESILVSVYISGIFSLNASHENHDQMPLNFQFYQNLKLVPKSFPFRRHYFSMYSKYSYPEHDYL